MGNVVGIRVATGRAAPRGVGVKGLLASLGILLAMLAPLALPLPVAAYQEEFVADSLIAEEPVAPADDPIVESASAIAPVEEWAAPRTVYIPETGQTLDQLFLDFWRGGGGANAFGYPITPEFEENGRTVQYLSHARFEYWPEDSDNPVRLGDVGHELRPLAVRRYHLGVSRESMLAARTWLPVDRDEAPPEVDDWRYVPESKHGIWGLFRTFWEATGEAAYLGNPLTEEYVIAGITYQVFERGVLAWQPGSDVWLVPVGELLAARYGADTAPVAQGDLPAYSEALFVPPVTRPVDAIGAPPPPPGAARSIVVSLGRQQMWAYEGGTVVLSSLVSTGKAGFETPPGMFQILVKKEIEDMEGLIGGEYYDVPQVPDVMYFTDVGHAFHGAYWHNDFGAPRSHGCINLPLDVALWLYDWTAMGTTVLVIP